MNTKEYVNYVETDETLGAPNEVKEPRGKSTAAIVFGILSILANPLLGVLGIIFGSVACKLAGAVIADFEGMASAKLARVGKTLGTVGLVISTVCTVFGIALLAVGVFLLISAL